MQTVTKKATKKTVVKKKINFGTLKGKVKIQKDAFAPMEIVPAKNGFKFFN